MTIATFLSPEWEDKMQDKLIAMEEPIMEDLEDEAPAETRSSPAPSALPMIEVTHFDDTDHPTGTYRRPLHSFL